MNMVTSNAFLFLNIYSLLVTTGMKKLEVFIGEKKKILINFHFIYT